MLGHGPRCIQGGCCIVSSRHCSAVPRRPPRSLVIGLVGSSAVTNSLISVLKDEIKYERENFRKDEEVLERPPNDFLLTDTPGKRLFFLEKEYKNEEITIAVDLDNQEDDDDTSEQEESDEAEKEEGEEEVIPVRFIVSIIKAERFLRFVCESDGEFFTITGIEHAPVPAVSDEMDEEEDVDMAPDYTGPAFEELDETLQQAFMDYLEERGVTPELGGYLRLMYVNKMAEEYQEWLTRVKDFVSS